MKLTFDDLRDFLEQIEIEPTPQPQPGKKVIPHPLDRVPVLVVLPHEFVWFGTLHYANDRYRLSTASNLRYWEKRKGGLPEFAAKGPRDGDRIDKSEFDVFFDKALFFLPLGDWYGS